ncbi:MAG: hypothetical protein EAZ63_03660 [Runella slithyformis]|nr:MAG: hypothetical protein EAZ63_03660 [Runella slithyformis]
MFKSSLDDFAGVGVLMQQPNAAGVAALRLLPVERVLHFGEPAGWRLPNFGVLPVPVLKSGDLVLAGLPVDIEIEPDYTLMNEDMGEDAQGERYRVGVSFTIPKDRPELAMWVATHAGMRWIALLRDRNGYFRVCGTKEQPLRLTWSATPGSGRAGRSNRNFSLSADSWTPVYFAENISNDWLLGTGPYSHEHEATFNL